MAPTTQQLIKDVTFRNQNLTTEKAEVIIAQLRDLVAIDLSHNRMNALPRGIPYSLIALDLSFNKFRSFQTTHRLSNLVELKITNNFIDNTLWLSTAVSLEFLDLSDNRINVICGLELLSKLKLVHLDNNIISSPSAIRLLSLNKSLVDLSLQGNPVSVTKNYKTLVMGFVGTLKYLDGKAVKHRNRKLDVGYSDSYLLARGRNSADDVDGDDDENASLSYSFGSQRTTRDGASTTGSWSWKRSGGPTSRSVRSVPYSIASNERIYSDGWSTGADQDPLSMVRPRSPVPWRNPPQILPRDRKGNLVLNASAISGSDLSRILQNTSGASAARSFYSNAHDASFVSSSMAAHQLSGTGRDRARSVSPSRMSRFRSSSHALARPSSQHRERRGSPSQLSHQNSMYDSRRIYTGSSSSRSRGHSPQRGSPERLSSSSPQHWSSPALQRKNVTHSILKKLPLSPQRSPRPHRSQSALDESSVSAVGPPSSHGVNHDAPDYDDTGADADTSEYYQDAHQQPPGPQRSDDYFEHAGSRVVTGAGAGSDASSALAFLEEMWHEELIAEAKTVMAVQQEEQAADVAVSSSLQNRSALLRAIYNAERLRERKVSEREEERKRLPPPPVGENEVDWFHHHSGGKTPPYHRMSFRKDRPRKLAAGGGNSRSHSSGEDAETKGGVSDEEKYEKILSRAKGFSDASPGDSPPSSAASASCREASSVIEQSGRVSDALKANESPVAYTRYEDEGESCIEDVGLQEVGQRKYHVPVPHLPVLNRSKDSPDPGRRGSNPNRLNHQEQPGTAPRAKGTDMVDIDPMGAELMNIHRSFGDLEGLGDFEELEKLLITSQDADVAANGAAASASGAGGADEIARLRTVMQAIMERRRESISLLQKSIPT